MARTRKPQPPAAKPLRPDACARCNWTGLLTVYWRHRVTVAGVERTNDDECAAACACPRGQSLARFASAISVEARLAARPETVLVSVGKRLPSAVREAASSAPLFSAPPSPTATPAVPDHQRAAAGDTDDPDEVLF